MGSLKAQWLDESTETITRIDESILVAKQLLKRRLKKVNELTQTHGNNLSENQKLFIRDEKELIKTVNILIQEFEGKMHMDLGRVPPVFTDLEESVLGAAILEAEAFARIKHFIIPDHFFANEHKLICKALFDLGNNPIDMRTVVHQLRRNGTIEEAGGAHKVAELTTKVNGSSNIEYHARCLIEYAVRRELILGCSKVMNESYSDERDVFVLMEFVRRAYNRIDGWLKR